MTSPLVSFVIPVFNQASLIEQTIVSILDQTHRNLEIIATDDGSSDDSLKVLRSIDDPRLQVYSHSNRGQAKTINAGLTKVSGDYVKIMDGDDILNAHHVTAQLASVLDYPGRISACRWMYFFERPESATIVCEPTDKSYDHPFDWLYDTFTQTRGMLSAWQWMIPRHLVDEIGGFDERLSLEADMEFTVRLLCHCAGIRFTKDALLYYRKDTHSTMSMDRSRSAMESAVLATKCAYQHLTARESNRFDQIFANRLQYWAYEAYPTVPDVADRAEKDAMMLATPTNPLPGGITTRALTYFLPWRLVKRLKLAAYRWGWSIMLRRKQRTRLHKLMLIMRRS